MYGCENKHAPAAAPDAPPAPPAYSAAAATRLADRVFPYLVSKAAPDAFSFPDCNFRVQKSKESTARVVGWREFGLLNCLTLEASFAGPSIGRVANHVSPRLRICYRCVPVSSLLLCQASPYLDVLLPLCPSDIF